jgi:hypothetical protein
LNYETLAICRMLAEGGIPAMVVGLPIIATTPGFLLPDFGEPSQVGRMSLIRSHWTKGQVAASRKDNIR